MDLSKLNKEQKTAVEHKKGPLLVLSVAGTGKTRVLTSRFVYIVKNLNVNFNKIIAVTFTNKAANEIKEIVNSELQSSIDTPWIGTFHSIFAKFLRKHSNLVKLKSNFTILDIEDQKKLLKQVLEYCKVDKDISECISDRNIEIICGFKNPEDIVITPDNEFLLMSEFGGIEPYEEQKPGYFALLNLQTKEKIIPNILIEENIWGNSSCKRNKTKKYGPHGIDLVKREDGAYQLGVVNHFPDETIEMFEIFKESGSWNMVWRGCIEVPNEFYFNDISLKTNGGFYASHMYKRDITLNEWLFISLIKKNTGYLVEWSEDGFNKINGSEGSGSNGIALDRKKNIIYINYNQGDSITKFDLNTNTKVDKKFIEAPDNPYIDGDYVWVTSLDFQPNDFGRCEFDISCSLPFSVYKLDKNNLETINKYSFSKSVFGLPTVAVPFNNEIYLGSFHSDRIGIVKTN